MTIPIRTLNVIPEYIHGPGYMSHISLNVANIAVPDKLAFAYRKLRGPDKRIRYWTFNSKTNLGASLLGYVINVNEINKQAPPVIEGANFSQYMNRPLLNWFAEQTDANTLEENALYVFNRFHFLTLTGEELDELSRHVVKLSLKLPAKIRY